MKQATENKIKNLFFLHNIIVWKIQFLGKTVVNPLEPYGWQKLSGESLCTMWSCYGLPTTLRLADVWRNQRKDTALALFIRLKEKTDNNETLWFVWKLEEEILFMLETWRMLLLQIMSQKNRKRRNNKYRHRQNDFYARSGRNNWWRSKIYSKKGFEVESHQADLSQCNRLLNWKPKINF